VNLLIGVFTLGAIIVAFPDSNPAASMYVAEIAMKAFELIFDKPERDDWRTAQKIAIKHLRVLPFSFAIAVASL